MSGFIVQYNSDGRPVDRAVIADLTEQLRFRGPDQQNVWVDGNIGMGHALFKTTYEAEYENQPATIDKKVWITCSARIDDRENLVNKMGMKQSLDLSRTPDSELILHAYQKWGEECLGHLLGDFAFVIWDKPNQKLFCARDQLGTCQLYYSFIQNKLIVCNSLNTIRKHSNISKNLNNKAIGSFLLVGDHTIIDKNITVYKDILALAPAQKLVYQNNKLKKVTYWNVPQNNHALTYKNHFDYIEHFQEVFQEAVKDRIRIPSVCILMSGGMDSTSIAASAKNINPKTKIQAVTGVYDTLINDEEKYYAQMVAKYLDIPIHYHIHDNYKLFEKGITTTRPLQIMTPTQRNDTQRILASYNRVYLSGSTGDNLLAYTPFNLVQEKTNILSIISSIYQYMVYFQTLPYGIGIKGLVYPASKNTIRIATSLPYPSWLQPEFEEEENLKQIWSDFNQWMPSHPHKSHLKGQMQLTRFDWNSDDILLNPDFTLAEERDPYRDIRLINYIYSIPSFPWLSKKYILRKSMRSYLPLEVLKRPKTPLPNVLDKLIEKTPNNELNNWNPVEILSSYIDISKIANLNDWSIPSQQRFVDFRPRLLNQWLQQLTE